MLCLLFVPFVMLAGYAIGRTPGVLVTAVVLLLPGVAGVAGIFPRVAPAPEAFVIGGVGVTGDIFGILSLVCSSRSAGRCSFWPPTACLFVTKVGRCTIFSG